MSNTITNIPEAMALEQESLSYIVKRATTHALTTYAIREIMTVKGTLDMFTLYFMKRDPIPPYDDSYIDSLCDSSTGKAGAVLKVLEELESRLVKYEEEKEPCGAV